MLRSEPPNRSAVFLLVAAVAAVYAISFPGIFTWDDHFIVQDNPLVQHPDLATIFSSDYWGPGVNSGLYRPLTILSLAVNRTLLGSGPAGFHLVNVLLHLVATLLLYRMLLLLTGQGMLALVAAALFAVHPVHAEVVDIAVGRGELLAAVAVFGGLLAGLSTSRWGAPVACLCFAAGLLCKEHAVTFPLLLAAAQVWRYRSPKPLRRHLVLYAVMGAITAGWLILRLVYLPGAHLPSNMITPVENPLVALEPMAKLATVFKVQVRYLLLLLFPVRHAVIYTSAEIGPVTGMLSWWGLVGLAVFAVWGGLTWYSWRRHSWIGFGIVFYALASAVTANLLFLTPVLMAERYLYLPSAGICLALAALVVATVRRAGGGRRVLVTAAAVLVALYGWRGVVRNADFRSDVGLWEAETRRHPGNVRAWLTLGGAYERTGRWEDAERAERRAIEANPLFSEARLCLGFLLLGRSRFAEAEGCFRRVVEEGPGVSLIGILGLGRSVLDQGRPEEALGILELLPPELRLADAWRLRGEALERAGLGEAAARAYREALARGGDRSFLEGRIGRLEEVPRDPPPASRAP